MVAWKVFGMLREMLLGAIYVFIVVSFMMASGVTAVSDFLVGGACAPPFLACSPQLRLTRWRRSPYITGVLAVRSFHWVVLGVTSDALSAKTTRYLRFERGFTEVI